MKNTSIYEIWWSDKNPLDRVQYQRKYFPNIHYYELTDDDIQFIFNKQ